MDIKLNREEITSEENIFSGAPEQSVELDYVLPDYCPEIFRILKCSAVPSVLSCGVSGDRLTCELQVCIRVLYCGSESGAVQCITQKLSYTKTADLGCTPAEPRVTVSPRTEYMNCRAVNPRRLDVRGAVSLNISVTDRKTADIICDAFGGGLQLKKVPVTCPAGQLYAAKRLTVNEEFDLGLSKPPIINVLRSDAAVVSVDKKIISGKLIAKGELCINMLYSCRKDDSDSAEAMQFTLPFSQIVDMEGIDERYNCTVKAQVVTCDIEPRSDGDGNLKSADCAVTVLITCSAYRTQSAELAVDLYSTAYKTDGTAAEVKIEAPPRAIAGSTVAKGSLTYGNAGSSEDGGIDRIYDVWCSVSGVNARPDPENEQVAISGNARYTVMARSTEGTPIVLEKEEPFTAAVPMEGITENSVPEVALTPVSCSYNLSSDRSVEAKAELRIAGELRDFTRLTALTDITVDEDSPIDRGSGYALRLYFTDEGEDIWEIAKRYGTSVTAIMEENDIDEDFSSGGMLLIPIV